MGQITRSDEIIITLVETSDYKMSILSKETHLSMMTWHTCQKGSRMDFTMDGAETTTLR